MSVAVSFSGGLDSTVLLTRAAREHGPDNVRAVSFDYGQRHGSSELAAGQRVCDALGVARHLVDLSSLASHLPGSALTDQSVEVPDGHYAEPVMALTVVPNRNLIMLSVAAGIALAHGDGEVWAGMHAGDHPVYPDCRPEFVDAADAAIRLGTGGKVGLRAPFVHMSKTDIVRIGADLDAPLGLSWSCYRGGPVACGACSTDFERREAFRDAGVPDPTVYLATPEYVAP
jgi:7-cyano-7-deazaguanine synthase